MLFPMLNVMYFYISAFRSMCVVPYAIVSCCCLISCFPGIIIIIIICVVNG